MAKRELCNIKYARPQRPRQADASGGQGGIVDAASFTAGHRNLTEN